jgi:uracil-DNA glycosylase family 4
MTKLKTKISLNVYQGDNMARLGNLYNEWSNCQKCDLGNFRPTDSGIVFGNGNPDAKIVIVGEAPGAEEEETGLPFVGSSGRLLNQMLAQVSDDTGIQELVKWYSKAPRHKDNDTKFQAAINDWRNDEFFVTNAVCCRPPENRTPIPDELEACWERLYNIIYTIDPWIIIAVGKSALQTLLRKKQVELTKYRGQVFDAEYTGRITKMKYTIIPIFHPSYLLRKADWKVKGGDFEKTLKDLYTAMKIYDRMREQYLGIPIPVRMEPK